MEGHGRLSPEPACSPGGLGARHGYVTPCPRTARVHGKHHFRTERDGPHREKSMNLPRPRPRPRARGDRFSNAGFLGPGRGWLREAWPGRPCLTFSFAAWGRAIRVGNELRVLCVLGLKRRVERAVSHPLGPGRRGRAGSCGMAWASSIHSWGFGDDRSPDPGTDLARGYKMFPHPKREEARRSRRGLKILPFSRARHPPSARERNLARTYGYSVGQRQTWSKRAEM